MNLKANFILRLIVTITFVFSSIFLLLPQGTYAHLNGVPIAKINGKDTLVYPIYADTPAFFNLPVETDRAPENYLLQQEVVYELDLLKLPTPPEIWAKTDLIWDFGDGSPKEVLQNGAKNSHRYTKIGTYVMQVSADYAKAGFESLGVQPIQTTVIHILPTPDYKLPQAKIKINDQMHDLQKKDQFSFKESYTIDLSKTVSFDASPSIKGTSNIAKYQWEMGTKVKNNNAKFTYSFTPDDDFITVLLRVTDSNGFFTDDYATIRNKDKPAEDVAGEENSYTFLAILLGAIVVSTLICIALWFVLSKIPKKRKH